MNVKASEVQIIYAQLEPTGEWLMASCELPDIPGRYRWRLVRMNTILIDAGFELKPGTTIKDHLGKAVEEFAHSRERFERLFHSTNRGMGVRMPRYETRGVTPFNCHFQEFKAMVTQWALRVPNRLRRQDFKVFLPWADAEKALRLSL